MWLPHFPGTLRFLLFLRKYLILERQISGCEWENIMSHLLVPKSQKSWGTSKSGGQNSDLVKHL